MLTLTREFNRTYPSWQMWANEKPAIWTHYESRNRSRAWSGDDAEKVKVLGFLFITSTLVPMMELPMLRVRIGPCLTSGMDRDWDRLEDPKAAEDGWERLWILSDCEARHLQQCSFVVGATQCVKPERLALLRTNGKTTPIVLSKILSRFNIVPSGISTQRTSLDDQLRRGNELWHRTRSRSKVGTVLYVHP
jgi:hypothetical protein